MVSCILCGTSKTTTNKRKGITFHKFPQNDVTRNRWLKFAEIRRVTEGTVLCSKHFSDECFDRSSELKVSLRSGAVPTLYVERLKFARKSNPDIIKAEPVSTILPEVPKVSFTTEEEAFFREDEFIVVEPTACLADENSRLYSSLTNSDTFVGSCVYSTKLVVTPTCNIESHREKNPEVAALQRKIDTLQSQQRIQSFRIRKLQHRNWHLQQQVDKFRSMVDAGLGKTRKCAARERLDSE